MRRGRAGVQMRCRERGWRLPSRLGRAGCGSIVSEAAGGGARRLVQVVAAISDAAGKAVPAGVAAEMSPPEPDTAEEAPLGSPSMESLGGGGPPCRWAEWVASTTFSSTGLTFGYDRQEVDAFRSAVRDTFLGVGKPPVRSDDVRGEWFSIDWPGYDRTQVDLFLEAPASGWPRWGRAREGHRGVREHVR